MGWWILVLEVGGVLVASSRKGTLRFLGTVGLSNVCSQLCRDVSG